MRFDQRTELYLRQQIIYLRQRFRFRRPDVRLESVHCRQRYLLHRLAPGDQHPLSGFMTKKSFTVFGAYSLFP
jgi:hypothetical protein